MAKAVVLFSGGLDSTVILAQALHQEIECLALSFDYGQRHRIEIDRAKKIAEYYSVKHKIIAIDPSAFDLSSLTSRRQVPKHRLPAEILKKGIPSTYVPARNTLFLAFALGQAEIWNAEEIYFGANAMDASPYPDCRPEFINAFQTVSSFATKQAVSGNPVKIIAPLLFSTKTEIVRLGKTLKIPFDLTWSCYDPLEGEKPCQACDACTLRSEGFKTFLID